MRILITNDDGTNAPGLAVLERIAATLTDADNIWVVAPESDQSGLAHSLTLNEPLRLRKIDKQKYALKGTPTDCIIMGVSEIMDEKPDLVLSGVNSGQNIGDDVTYSGTVAGAMEGALLGIRSIAVSQAYDFGGGVRTVPWDTVETLGPDIIRQVLELEFPYKTLVNINFPNCAPNEVTGVEITRQGAFSNALSMEKRHDGRGFPYYWIRFTRDVPEQKPGADIAAIQENRISISPLKLDMTDFDFREKMLEKFGE